MLDKQLKTKLMIACRIPLVAIILMLVATKAVSGEAEDIYYQAEAEENFGKKVELLKRIQNDYRGSRWAAKTHIDLGEILLLKGEYASAVKELSAIESEYESLPYGGRGFYLLALSYLASAERDKAMVLLERVVNNYPASAEATSAAERLIFLRLSDHKTEYYLQAGVYSNPEGAEASRAALKEKGLDAAVISGEVYKVVIGPFEDDIEAQIESENIKSRMGVDSFVIEH